MPREDRKHVVVFDMILHYRAVYRAVLQCGNQKQEWLMVRHLGTLRTTAQEYRTPILDHPRNRDVLARLILLQ
jgi:hypothetical protein